MSLRVVIVAAVVAAAAGGLQRLPPMGWMSWQFFRCEIDCDKHPTACINEALYKSQTDALVSGGYVAAGYNGIHIDDCWMRLNPVRDPLTGRLVPNATRFPSGMQALGDYMHAVGVKFGQYTAESSGTCAGYPASKGHEDLDAQTFADWGVDYLKVDGCGDPSYYAQGYAAMGAALTATGRDITYSCSWPAYVGDNETTKPFATYIADGCNLWRNWDDIDCNWNSLNSIIQHWGDYGATLVKFAGPGHVHDPDMLLIGAGCLSDDEARTQMAIWAISAAPLIMGNDLRSVNSSQRAILLNTEAIAVDQDAAVIMGTRVGPSGPTEVWVRPLSGGAFAVGAFNKEGGTTPPPGPCPKWNETQKGYLESCSGNSKCFSGVSVPDAQAACCASSVCAGFSYMPSDGSGCYKLDTNCGAVNSTNYVGYYKPTFTPAACTPANITVSFASIGVTYTTVAVRDVWAHKFIGMFSGSFTATNVPCHGTAFYTLTDGAAHIDAEK